MSVWREILADLKAAVFGPGAGAPAGAAERPEPAAPVLVPAAPEPVPAIPEPAPTPALLAAPPRKARWPLVAVVLAAMLVGAVIVARSALGARAPARDVVATYTHPWRDGGQEVRVTQAGLAAYLSGLPGEAPGAVDGYRAALEQMVVDDLLWDWLLGRLGPGSLQALVADVVYGRHPVSTFDAVIPAIPIADSDVRAYYEGHPEQFEGQALSEARPEILDLLRQQQAASHIQGYIAGLRDRATVVQHPDVLAVPEPEESALRAYYQAHLDELTPPRTAQVSLLRFRRQESAPQVAETVRAELGQGQDLATLRQTYYRHATVVDDTLLVEGQHNETFDEIAFGLQAGEISSVIDGGDAFYIVRMLQPFPAPALDYEGVKEQIRALLWAEAAGPWFEARADEAVFEMGGHAYRAGDLYAALQAQPEEVRAAHRSTQGVRDLVEGAIDRLLVAEDARRQGYPPEGRGGATARLDLLAQVTGTESALDLTVSDDEVADYYYQHPEEFVMPARFRVQYLALDTGSTEAEGRRAWNAAQEAYDRLLQLEGPSEEVDFLEVASGLVEDPSRGMPSAWVVAARPEAIEVIDTGEELMAHPLYERLLDLQAGEITPPFELDGVLYVVQVLEREEEKQLDLYAATNALNVILNEENARARVQELGSVLLEQMGWTVYEGNLGKGLGTTP